MWEDYEDEKKAHASTKKYTEGIDRVLLKRSDLWSTWGNYELKVSEYYKDNKSIV